MYLPRVRSLAGFLLLLLALHLGGGRLVRAQTPSGPTQTVRGHVVNGSAGGAPVGGTRVVLASRPQEGTAAGNPVAATTTDQSGMFQFDMAELDKGDYAASVSYQGVTYASTIDWSAGTAPLDATVTVYEPTERADTIRIERMSLVVAGADAKSGVLTVVESYHLINDGSETFVGAASAGQRQSLQVPLFPGARSLTPLGGFGLNDAVATARGFALSSPVLPGRSTISFTYDVPYQGRGSRLSRSLVYPVALAEAVLPPGLRMTSLQLALGGTVQLGNRTFDTIRGTSLPAGTTIDLDVAGLPARPGPAIDWASQPAATLVMAVIVAGVAFLVAMLRQRARPTSLAALKRERVELLRLVAELDDRAERGGIEATEYRRRRRETMARLERLSVLLREGEGASESRAEATPTARTAT